MPNQKKFFVAARLDARLFAQAVPPPEQNNHALHLLSDDAGVNKRFAHAGTDRLNAWHSAFCGWHSHLRHAEFKRS
jgi:hypothetical protein